ncbi:putative HAUS augmin-like complex subunit 5 [Helianthus annuus]|nr:putative HAUS augmin-like complex subunit 5 [Helianthus annuus]KAJ0905935.1 putative HAUS augmin-like complex subunit 5 [Helianthus annuus]
MNQWLPDLKKSIESGEKSLNDCKYIEGLVSDMFSVPEYMLYRILSLLADVVMMQLDEWWEQPASTLVDWVTLDDQNVVAWQNHVKQLLAAYDKELF